MLIKKSYVFIDYTVAAAALQYVAVCKHTVVGT